MDLLGLKGLGLLEYLLKSRREDNKKEEQKSKSYESVSKHFEKWWIKLSLKEKIVYKFWLYVYMIQIEIVLFLVKIKEYFVGLRRK